MTDVAAGWYPDPTIPGGERWWNGEAWGDEVRALATAPIVPPESAYVPPPAPQYVPPPAPAPQYVPAAAPGKAKSGCLGTSMGVMFGILGAIVLLVGGCIAVFAVASGGGDDGQSVAVDRVEGDVSEIAGAESESDEVAEKGTIENPYQFGEAHTREAGLLGAGWTISVDEVRSISKGILADEADPRTCMAIIVTVTLDSLDGDELTANPFSFPDMAVVDMNGKKSEDGFMECDGSELVAEGITGKFELELTVGGTGRFYDPVLLETPTYQYVAVESTVYGS